MTRIVHLRDNCLFLFIFLCLTSVTGYCQSTPASQHNKSSQVSGVSPLSKTPTSKSELLKAKQPASAVSINAIKDNRGKTTDLEATVLLSSILLLIGGSIAYRRFILNGKTIANIQSDRRPTAFRAPVYNRIYGDGITLIPEGEQLPEHTEWGFQEWHRRIKTNLHHVLELLNVPSLIGNDPKALKAVEFNSRKLYALAYAHHKLREAPHNSPVDMNELIPDLIECLTHAPEKHSTARIIFSSPAHCIELEPAQALALTMVINDILSWFMTRSDRNYFLESIGLYLQEAKEQVKLTVKTEGLYRSKDFDHLKNELRQTLVTHFDDAYNARFSIDNNLGIQLNLQFEKQVSRKTALA